ncbi:peptidylprolyl isomerase [Cronbergia sp. UHCC 0137]|uniref:peptidylprolyl isomerase n=1 Tax=Cronbergia sp. UHCC 0137 TaxID=3110239 RepID=UPI002B20832C|nr:peptidylprolyl isomerase [Cronbergia sp. UHCC 0137]MEA5620116.1 peptidylprolyl isomerase [Cronbergia sp. UHCC 0137]
MIEFKGENIYPEEVITYLKKNLQIKEVCNNILYQKIITQAVKERDINITPEEIQVEADRIRYENRLVKANDTLAWLTDQLVLPNDWENGIRDILLTKKLAESLFAKEVEKYFLENQLDYDQFLLYQIVVPYPQLAQEICYQIQEGELSFYDAAHIYDIDERRRKHCGYEGQFSRWNLKPDVASVVFNAKPKDVLDPLIIDQKSYILMVEEFIPAELTPQRHQEILDKMFKEWLAAELNYLLHA